MRKIFFLTALLMMILTATAFAEDTAEETAEPTDEPYIYTSEDFKFTITCPIKPVAVVENPWQEIEKHGEMLVFLNEGFDVLFGYVIQVDAFNTEDVPDFNKASMAIMGDYLESLKENGGFADARPVNITKKNKGVSVITADKIQVLNKETGEVEGELIADKQYIYTFFRTPEGRCISIQLICADLGNKQLIDTYHASVASFTDNIKDSKSKDKKSKDKKSKDKKSKDKKSKDKK